MSTFPTHDDPVDVGEVEVQVVQAEARTRGFASLAGIFLNSSISLSIVDSQRTLQPRGFPETLGLSFPLSVPGAS